MSQNLNTAAVTLGADENGRNGCQWVRLLVYYVYQFNSHHGLFLNHYITQRILKLLGGGGRGGRLPLEFKHRIST